MRHAELSIVNLVNASLRRRASIITIVLALLIAPAILPAVTAGEGDPLTCQIQVDWVDRDDFYMSAAHGYSIQFSRNLTALDTDNISVTWSHNNASGGVIEANASLLNGSGRILNAENASVARLVLDEMPEFSDEISISVGGNGSAAICQRDVRTTVWNQPIADHEITLDTTWSLEQKNDSADTSYDLVFSGRGWQQRVGTLLESNELGDGLLTIVTDDGSTEMEIQLLLDRVWLNETADGGELKSQVFEMFGNGSMAFVTTDEMGVETNLTLNVTNSYIIRSLDHGATAESIRIEAFGQMATAGNNDNESINLTGDVSLFLLETEHENGSRTMQFFEFQAMADLTMESDDFRFDIDLQEFLMRERWEGDERTDQYSLMRGDGAFDLRVSEGNGTMDVNGTVDQFWFETENGSTIQTRIYSDGDISGDVEGELGFILDVIESGTEQNSNGTSYDVNVIRQESWLNISSVTVFGQDFTDLEAEHNLTYNYEVPAEHWSNRTVMYRYVEDDGRVNDERPERSPIELNLTAPDDDAVIGDANVTRETGVVPEELRAGDEVVLDAGDILTLRIVAATADVIIRDGHEIQVVRWSGVYSGPDGYGESGGTATGAVGNIGVLAGLVVEVSRNATFDIAGENISFIEQQALARVLSPSIINAGGNTDPKAASVSWYEGELTTEGGVAHLEVVVDDPDWNMRSVSADLSAIGLGTVELSDVGLDGDRVIHDDIWTAKVEHEGLDWGNISVPLTITDAWTSVQTDATQFVDNLAPRLLSFTPSPNSVHRGENISVEATAFDGHGVAAVAVDMRASGGALHNLSESAGVWSGTVLIPDGFSPGPHSLTVRLEDSDGAWRETTVMLGSGEGSSDGGSTIPVTPVTILNDGPRLSNVQLLRYNKTVESVLIPDVGDAVISHVLSVYVYDADGVQTVQVRLGPAAPVGQSSDWLLMRDDGTQGDLVAGDGNYSITIIPRSSMPAGTVDIEIRGLDTYLESTPGADRTFQITLGAGSGGGGGDPSDTLAFLSGPIIIIALFILLLIGAVVAVVFMLRSSEFGDGDEGVNDGSGDLFGPA